MTSNFLSKLLKYSKYDTKKYYSEYTASHVKPTTHFVRLPIQKLSITLVVWIVMALGPGVVLGKRWGN
jgi:hypothetical protein